MGGGDTSDEQLQFCVRARSANAIKKIPCINCKEKVTKKYAEISRKSLYT